MYGTIADKPDDDEDGTEPRPYTRTGRACRAEDHTGGQLLYCSIAQWGGGCGGVYGLAGLLLLAHSKSVDPRYLTLMGSGFDGPYHHLTGAPPLAIGGEEEVEDRGRWRHAQSLAKVLSCTMHPGR